MSTQGERSATLLGAFRHRMRGAWTRPEWILLGLVFLLAMGSVVSLAFGLDLLTHGLLVSSGLAVALLVALVARRTRVLHSRLADDIRTSAEWVIHSGHGSKRDGRPPMTGVAPAAPATAVPQVLRDYVALYEGAGFLREIDRTILRTGSIAGRDILATMATGGTQTWSQVRAAIASFRDPRLRSKVQPVFAAMDIRLARRLARVVALQALLPDDRVNALTLYKALLATHGLRCLDLQHAKLAADLAFYLRDWKMLKEALQSFSLKEADRQFLEADMANPFIDSPFKDAGRWVELINRGFVRAGVAPILVEEEDEADTRLPFDRLATLSLAPVHGNEKVTVVITSWCPDQSLVFAVRSITKQTWQNLEILLIDDASPDEYLPLLQQVAAMDDRIRLIRQPLNGGTYMSRNRGLHEATGQYFTVHDSDDWSHPQRIELQLKALLADDALVSTGSFAYRCDDDLVVNFPGVTPDRENASSLLFELDKVRSRIGYYDVSRKGADTEYALRIRMAFGDESHRILLQPLAMIRLRPGSLSREEFKPGWRHAARALYRRSYETWHRHVKLRGDDGHREFSPAARAFRSPLRFLIDQAGEEVLRRSHYDVVYVADFRASASPELSIAHEAVASARAGLRVGILHLESYRNLSLREIEPFDIEIEELLQKDLLCEVLYTDNTTVGTLVIRDPSILQFPLPSASALRVQSALIIASHGGRGDDRRLQFDVADCAVACFRMFGVEGRWVATNEAALQEIADAISVRALSPALWPTSVVADLATAPAGRRGMEGPVVGRVLHGAKNTLPQGHASRKKAFCADSATIQMRFLDDPQRPLGSLLGDELPSNWVMESRQQVPKFVFYAQCDFYVHHHSGGADEVQARFIVEAMAAGCVPVLQPSWEGLFGKAAVYCEPSDVERQISDLHQDVERYLDLQSRGVAWAETHHGHGLLAEAWARIKSEN